jgi:hypothetical protein
MSHGTAHQRDAETIRGLGPRRSAPAEEEEMKSARVVHVRQNARTRAQNARAEHQNVRKIEHKALTDLHWLYQRRTRGKGGKVAAVAAVMRNAIRRMIDKHLCQSTILVSYVPRNGSSLSSRSKEIQTLQGTD